MNDLLAMPKVELHCHLEACFRPETVMEIGRTLGLALPTEPERFRSEWLLTEPLANLEIALARFVDIQRIWCSEEVIERMTTEACEYAVEQGIRIMEFRYSPDFIMGGKSGLDMEGIHAAICRGIEAADTSELAVGLIGIVQKTLPLKDAERTIEFMIANRDTVVGIDFADMDVRPIREYAPMTARARAAGLHVTAHAGEAPGPDAPGEVRDAIEQLGAERIGHGIHVIHDESVMALLRERDIPLEVCPTSNWLTSAVPTTAAHPIAKLRASGVPVTINSDDPALFGIDLLHEYRILAEEHNFTDEDFRACNELALAKSFVSDQEKRRVWPEDAA